MGAFHSRQEDQINTLLPPELLDHVFHLLAPQDLKAAVLVCRLWREVGEAPGLWSWVGLRVTRENQSTILEALDSRRLKSARMLSVEEVTNEVLEAVVRHQGLRLMKVEDAVLSTVDPNLLARAVTRLEELEMEFSQLTLKQREAILTSISGGDCQLKKLNISSMYSCDLTDIRPCLLARAVQRLEKVDMRNTKLVVQQWEEILTAISMKESRLKRLNIGFADLSTVDTGLLARAVNRLEKVDMYVTKLTVEQVEAILTNISTGDSQLKGLNITGINLSTLDSAMLARAVDRLEEVGLASTKLTSEQWRAILTSIATENSKLKMLSIGNNKMSTLEPSLLARAVIRLEKVNLLQTQLTGPQVEAIFTAINEKGSLLKNLNISGTNLSTLDPCLVARAVSRIKHQDLLRWV